MGRNMGIWTTIRQALNVIPREHISEIKTEIIGVNSSRIRDLSIVLIIMNIAMIVFDLWFYLPRWESNSAYINLFLAHLFMLAERSLYLLAESLLNRKTKGLHYKLQSILILYSCIMSLAWCSYLSINAQSIHGQISAYIIGNFSIALSALLLPKQGLALFAANSGIFAIILYFTPKLQENYPSNAMNILFVFAFSYILSYMNIYMFINTYMHKKIIRKQAGELEASKDRLEDLVRLRTEELVRANEELVKEMGIRHEVELQSIRTRLMYEENALLLREIKEYEELRNVFFANLSHELRTPLNVIFSAQQMMNLVISNQSCNGCKDQISKYNKIVRQNCYRLIRLIGNLIDITKIDAKYFEISKKNCDIVKLVESITQSVADYIKDKDMGLSFETTLSNKVIACDPDKIERIMLNLLSNAVKFTPQKGQINVSVKLVPGKVVISVRDTGIGISWEMQQVVFERFIQADKSMTRNREGSGIGLSLVKSLVDMHQGRIYIISEPGKGSEFVVELPDEAIPFDDCIACTSDDNGQNIDRIHIEFSDIYS